MAQKEQTVILQKALFIGITYHLEMIHRILLIMELQYLAQLVLELMVLALKIVVVKL